MYKSGDWLSNIHVVIELKKTQNHRDQLNFVKELCICRKLDSASKSLSGKFTKKYSYVE